MYQSGNVKFNPLITLDASTLTGSYIPFGTAFTYPPRLIHFINDSDENVLISFDNGATAHIFLKAGSFVLYDFSANRSESSGVLQLSPTGMMINGASGTGDIYAVSFGAYTPSYPLPGV